jgi:predicted HTH domain antitoxin
MDSTITIELPRHLVNAAKFTTEELKIELAVHLYENRRLSIGHAREMAGLSLWEFRQLLASRKISPHYSVSDLDRDVETWTELDRDFSAR